MSEPGVPFARETVLLAAVLLLGVVGPGLARRALVVAGHDTVGTIVFVLGYVGTAVVLWYGWIRPLDITGPSAR